MRIQVAYGAPGVERLVELDLPDGASVADAVRAAGLVDGAAAAGEGPWPGASGHESGSGPDPSRLTFAIHGQGAASGTPLRDGDRVEVLRPLTADPKAVRRDRATGHLRPTRPAPAKRRR
jgi:putative ubiquitin-RnfH superfamily antitoxin RatB of RatAB toxin-antitoxin module